jgi:MFS family permease
MITAANTFMQLHTEPGMRGRVMALYMMIFIGGTPLGAPLIGWIGEVAGARWTLLGGGLATFAGVSLASVLYLRHHRRLVAAQTPQQPEQLEPAAA